MLNLMNIGAASRLRLKDKIAAPLEQMVALESLEMVLQAAFNGERSFNDSDVQSKMNRFRQMRARSCSAAPERPHRGGAGDARGMHAIGGDEEHPPDSAFGELGMNTATRSLPRTSVCTPIRHALPRLASTTG